MTKDSIGIQILRVIVLIIVVGSVFAGAIYMLLQKISEIFTCLTIILFIASIVAGIFAFYENEEKLYLLLGILMLFTLFFGYFAYITYEVSHTPEANKKIDEFKKEFAPFLIIFQVEDVKQLIIAELDEVTKEAVVNMCEQSSVENCEELIRLIDTGRIALETIPDAYSKGIKLEKFLQTVSKK